MTTPALAVPLTQGPAALPRETIALVHGLWEPAWLVDGHTLRVIAINAPALALLGREQADVIDQPADKLLETPES